MQNFTVRYTVLSLNGNPKRFFTDGSAEFVAVFIGGDTRAGVLFGIAIESTKVNVSASIGHHKCTF